MTMADDDGGCRRFTTFAFVGERSGYLSQVASYFVSSFGEGVCDFGACLVVKFYLNSIGFLTVIL